MTTPTIIIYIIIIALLVLFYSLMVLISVAIKRSREVQINELGLDKGRAGKLALAILEREDKHIFHIQIAKFFLAMFLGICIVNLSSALVATSMDSDLGLQNGGFLFIVIFLLLIIPITFITLVLSQILRAVAFRMPERILCLCAWLVVLLGNGMAPFERLSGIIENRILDFMKLSSPPDSEYPISAEEISEIVEISTRAGEIEEDEFEMIQGVFSFSDTMVKEVMTPRVDVIAVQEDQPLEEVIKLFADEGLSRLVVYGRDLDDVRGVVLAKDFIPLVGKAVADFDLKKLLRKPYFAPATQLIDDLLKSFRDEAQHFAVVLDEHGGVQGVVTLEDLIEEIVGEIFDEHDNPEEELRKTKKGDYLVGGSMLLDDLNSACDFHLPPGEYDTVAGFVIQSLGHIPKKGEVLRYEGIKIQVEKISHNRVTLLRFSKS